MAFFNRKAKSTTLETPIRHERSTEASLPPPAESIALRAVQDWCESNGSKRPAVLLWPNKVLNTPSLTVEYPADNVIAWTYTMGLLKDILHDRMIEERGVGLAAVQLGVLVRAFVIAIDPLDLTKGVELYINPSWQSLTRLRSVKEGCLSFPNQFVDVPRFDAVQTQWTDLTGVHHDVTLSAFQAQAFQHEHDHLTGVTLADKVPGKKSKMRADAVRYKKDQSHTKSRR